MFHAKKADPVLGVDAKILYEESDIENFVITSFETLMKKLEHYNSADKLNSSIFIFHLSYFNYFLKIIRSLWSLDYVHHFDVHITDTCTQSFGSSVPIPKFLKNRHGILRVNVPQG